MGGNDPGLGRLRADLVQEIRASEARTVQRFEAFDTRFEAVDAKVDAADARMRERFEVFETRLRSHIDAAEAGIRRHFGLVADDLRSQIQVVAEGVVALDEKVKRFRGEVQANVAKVEARVSGLEHR